jgi:membrane glycosyltransferase
LLESQKQILGSFQSAWLPHIDAANIFVSNWMSPGHYSQIYANMVSNFADNIIVGTRLANSMIFANMESSKTLMLQARDNTKELSRSNVNAARSLEQTSRDAASNVRQNNTSTSYTREYEANEPMSPAKIKEHEPTAVRRQDNTSSSSTSSSSGQDPKERLRRSGMTEGTAGSTETGDEYEQGASGTNK